MRLITHNLLSCHAARPGQPCVPPNNFPLHFKDVSRVEVIESEMNPDFLRNMMHKIDYAALVGAARQLADDSLPERPPDIGTSGQEVDEMNQDQQQGIAKLHHALLEIHVQDGAMVCPMCEHVYLIRDGIPNMLLAEHEIKR